MGGSGEAVARAKKFFRIEAGRAHCQLCQNGKKPVALKCEGSRFGSLINHMKAVHPEEWNTSTPQPTPAPQDDPKAAARKRMREIYPQIALFARFAWPRRLVEAESWRTFMTLVREGDDALTDDDAKLLGQQLMHDIENLSDGDSDDDDRTKQADADTLTSAE